jgi:hypothetical protein
MFGRHRFATAIFKSVDNKGRYKATFGDGTEYEEDISEHMNLAYCADCRLVFCSSVA